MIVCYFGTYRQNQCSNKCFLGGIWILSDVHKKSIRVEIAKVFRRCPMRLTGKKAEEHFQEAVQKYAA
jgi:hypothetical protein